MVRIRNIKELNKYGFPDHITAQIRREFYKAKNDHSTTDTTPDSKRSFQCEPLGTKENPRFNTPVRIVVRSTRRSETDFRAVSEKAVVDGLVKAGILKDDRKKKYVAELIVEEPEISSEEKTIIEIMEV